MTLVSLDKIERRFGDLVVLDGASLRVEDRERIGIIGDNGVGKTTLIRILAGVDEPDRGARNCRRNLRIGYAAQIPDLREGTSVYDFVMRGNGEFPALLARIQTLEAVLAESPKDEKALASYGALHAAFEAGGGYDREHLCERVLDGLGFSQLDREKDVSVLSGGESSRVVLASLMLQPVDLLIVDEPTNHLDLQGIEFVERYVQKHPGAVVVVSHDRQFLDAIATSIVEVEFGVAAKFKGNYTAFIKQTDNNLLSQSRAFKDQQAFIKKEMEFICKHMGSRLTAQAKGRLKRVKRLQLIARPKTGKGSGVKLQFTGGRGQSGQSILEIEDLAAKIPTGRELFSGVTFRLLHGETLGLLGRNGSGKTTMLKILCGLAAPSAGEVRRAHKVRPGVFTQEMSDLPRSGNVLEALSEVAPQATGKELRDHLGLFMFSGYEVEKSVDTLSGGEKRRLCLARLVWGEYDYLCLDEPTNHLDITAREGLEEAVRSYSGATLVISHDREFLNAVTDRIIYLDDNGLRTFDGGIEQCIEALREERLAKKAGKRAAKTQQSAKTGGGAATETRSTSTTEKIRNPLMFKRLEDQICELEAKLETVRADMLLEANYSNHQNLQALQSQESDLTTQLAEAYESWENW